MLQKELVAFCAERNIQVVAYSSLGCGHLLHDEDIMNACKKGSVDTPLALLRWGVQTGMCVICKSTVHSRLQLMRPDSVLAAGLPASLQNDLHNCDSPSGKFCWDPKTLL